ncbi:electron transfer flavoprotein subunit alpha/FixB family protein [Vibrio sinaloensis]|uniref:electron transfer flavoprotein subunit alpha/FixB family protein n=1 Tax=Photobacterium sp. (strain ATCC 43367) TaxID=379097 RepID=UPI0022B03D01|nr:FAD-binding protein [Vibrio sinaloensis]MCZ4293248.1 FAD-binding protein [Vibrio sinaloensis]
MSEANILVVAEHDHKTISAATLSVLTAAMQLKGFSSDAKLSVLVAGNPCDEVCNQLNGCEGIDELLVADSPVYQSQLSENLAQLVMSCASEYGYLLCSASSFGKDIMPRIAAMLGVGMMSDVVAIESDDTIVRPIYAGNALARVQSHDDVKVMTVRSTAFDKISLVGANTVKKVNLDLSIDCQGTELIRRDKIQSERPELSNADVVVSGGRGVGSKENFAMVEALADKLGGAIGASRAAVDAGFVTNDLQVGQTGKIVAPRLYIAVGISGAIQHLAGMKDSKVIVAINSDPDAPIFEIADYGIVGDLFTLLPELIEQVGRNGG